jgi:aminoglycoside phosphotransferase (APT) family kinase protein
VAPAVGLNGAMSPAIDAPVVPHGRTARRLAWQHLPPTIREMVETRLGSRVVSARSQDSGYTPGFASRLLAEDGSRLFVKAASRVAQRSIATAYAEEARMLRDLAPYAVPAPGLRWAHEDEEWVVLGLEDVEARTPVRPWRPDELQRTLDLLTEVAQTTAGLGEGLPSVTTAFPGMTDAWRIFVARSPGDRHIRAAAALAARLPELPRQGFVHGDARDDNVLLCADGATLLCDWNWPCRGPVWLDVVDVLVSAHGDGLDAAPMLASHPLTADVPDEEIDVWLAAFAGFMRRGGEQPLRPSSPFLGVHARWSAQAAWSWLSERRGW